MADETMANSLKEAFENGSFVVTCEMIPGRGARSETQEKLVAQAKELFATGRVHAISITDNPGGNPALSSDAFASELLSYGITPLVHMSCKDRNRNMLTSALYVMERAGIQNILAMTGDYPTSGWSGVARPVFDLDPVQLLQMISDMNAGLRVTNAGEAVPAEDAKSEPPTHFFAGACISPFKYNEGELIPQYFKLNKKIHAGAQFVISQVGYDARKMQELIWYMNDHGYGDIPAIANIYILPAGAARYMNGGGVPGVVVTDELLATLTQERDSSEDKGKQARLLRAAKMIAIARGMGYRGVHIGGTGVNAQSVCQILDMADELQNDWMTWASEINYGREGGFYYYERDEQTGLNLQAADGSHVLAQRPEQHHERSVQKNYGLSRFMHKFMFTPGKGIFPLFHKKMESSEKKWDAKLGEGKGKYRPHGFEHVNKTLIFSYQDCGDCGLASCGYVCPMTQCPKCQRNGPCGGSDDGWCEVYPGVRRCIYYRAYFRLKKYGDQESLGDWLVCPNNWANFETSPWGNYHHGRDNLARRERLTPWRDNEHREPPFEEW